MRDPNRECNLIFIKSNFSALTNASLHLEKLGRPLSASIKTVLDVQNKIEEVQNKIDKAVQLKMKTILENNTGLNQYVQSQQF